MSHRTEPVLSVEDVLAVLVSEAADVAERLDGRLRLLLRRADAPEAAVAQHDM